jgi:hypothetical protein
VACLNGDINGTYQWKNMTMNDAIGNEQRSDGSAQNARDGLRAEIAAQTWEQSAELLAADILSVANGRG